LNEWKNVGTGTADNHRRQLISAKLPMSLREAVFAKYSQTVFSLPLYACIDLRSNYLSI